MRKKIVIIDEQGAAAEVTHQAEKALQAIAEQFDHQFEYERLPIEAIRLSADDAIAAGDGILVSGASAFSAIRAHMPVFVKVTPVAVYTSLQHLSPLKPKISEGTNIIIYQEDASLAGMDSRKRIAQSAFRQSAKRKGKIILTEQLNGDNAYSWNEVINQLSEKFKEVETGYTPAADLMRDLICNPSAHDIIIADSLTGGYLLDQAVAISGIPGAIPTAWASERAVFFGPAFGIREPAVQNSSSNPLGAVLSVAMMLDHFNLAEEASVVRTAVNWTLLHGFTTKDIDTVNNYATSTIGDLVSDFIRGTIPGFSKGENMILQKSTII